jgi:hypothetical protein
MLPRSSRSPFAPICFLSRSRLNPWSNSLRAPRAGRGRREERNSPDRRVDSRVDRAWFFHVSHGGRGTRVARQPRPSGQADRHRASQVSRTYVLAQHAASQVCVRVALCADSRRRHGDEASAAGTENRTVLRRRTARLSMVVV